MNGLTKELRYVRVFRRTYFAVVATLLVLLACIPSIDVISLRLAGYDRTMIEAYTPEAFRAYRETAWMRRGFAWGVLVLAVAIVALSVAALLPNRRVRSGVPWPFFVGTALGGALVALVALGALVFTPFTLCC